MTLKKDSQFLISTLRLVIFIAGISFILIGIKRGEVKEVFNKAVRICLECIGIV